MASRRILASMPLFMLFWLLGNLRDHLEVISRNLIEEHAGGPQLGGTRGSNIGQKGKLASDAATAKPS